MKHLDINVSTRGGGVWIGISELAALDYKWEGQLNEVADRIDGMSIFAGRGWFWSQLEFVCFL